MAKPKRRQSQTCRRNSTNYESKAHKTMNALLKTIIRESEQAARDKLPEFESLTKTQILSGGIKVARLYYEIAAEAIGEEAVRKKRDEILNA